MDLKRFFATEPINGDKIVISGEEFYHVVKVTRHKVGYSIIVCDNTDRDFYATIEKIERDCLIASIDKIEKNIAETNNNVSLYIGINKDLDTVIQKAVELGIKKIIPFTSQHGNITDINRERLQKIILESSKQCGRSYLANLSDTITFNEAILRAKNDNLLLFYEFESQNKVAECIVDKSKNTAIFIGSEGGFSKEEIEFAKQNNANILTLGKRILRVSTAVVSGITLCLDKLGEI
jgi:16S rRNA (uracil1498-N3)-methyltransferase